MHDTIKTHCCFSSRATHSRSRGPVEPKHLYFFRIVKERYSLWTKVQSEAFALGSGFSLHRGKIGGGDRSRTDDPLLAKQVLSH